MSVAQTLARRADFWSTIWIVVLCLMGAGALTAVSIIVRYGDWVYTEPLGMFGLTGLLVVVAALLGCVVGVALWLAMLGFDFLGRNLSAQWLGILFALTTALWFQAAMRKFFFAVASNPVYFAAIGFGLLCGPALVRRSRGWLRSDVLLLTLAGLALFGFLVWLNLEYIRRYSVIMTGKLNAAALIAGYGVACLGTLLGNRLRADIHTPRSNPIALAILVLVCGISVVPLYHVAFAAGELPGQSVIAKLPPMENAGPEPSTRTRVAPAPNLILISIDTLRADHLGIYGYSENTSPIIDAFFADGSVFKNMYSEAPWTLPSHMTMITGLHSSAHGSRAAAMPPLGRINSLPDAAITLAEILADHGYETSAVTGSTFLTRTYGFDQGFEFFSEAKGSAEMELVLDRALPWLAERDQEPFFLFLHSIDPHQYEPPNKIYPDIRVDEYDGPLKALGRAVGGFAVSDGFYELDEADIRYLIQLYDKEIRHLDEQLGRLFTQLEQQGLTDHTVVILTSDHGEAFWEHGSTGHGQTMFDSLLHIPLLVSVPGLRNAQRLEEPVQTVDLAPTLLDLAGVALEDYGYMHGRSLVPILQGGALRPVGILSEADYYDTTACLVKDGYKYVNHGILSHNLLDPVYAAASLKGLLSPYGRAEELYDIAADPDEMNNLAESDPERTEQLRFELLANLMLFRLDAATLKHAKMEVMSSEVEDNLRALGYIE